MRDSIGLTKKWNECSIDASSERLEALQALGIDTNFAEQLEDMFGKINATVGEITKCRSDILEGNSKLVEGDTRRATKYNLDSMKAANDI